MNTPLALLFKSDGVHMHSLYVYITTLPFGALYQHKN